MQSAWEQLGGRTILTARTVGKCLWDILRQHTLCVTHATARELRSLFDLDGTQLVRGFASYLNYASVFRRDSHSTLDISRFILQFLQLLQQFQGSDFAAQGFANVRILQAEVHWEEVARARAALKLPLSILFSLTLCSSPHRTPDCLWGWNQLGAVYIAARMYMEPFFNSPVTDEEIKRQAQQEEFVHASAFLVSRHSRGGDVADVHSEVLCTFWEQLLVLYSVICKHASVPVEQQNMLVHFLVEEMQEEPNAAPAFYGRMVAKVLPTDLTEMRSWLEGTELYSFLHAVSLSDPPLLAAWWTEVFRKLAGRLDPAAVNDGLMQIREPMFAFFSAARQPSAPLSVQSAARKIEEGLLRLDAHLMDVEEGGTWSEWILGGM